MEQDDLRITELDKMTSSYSLQMMKAALTYFPPAPKRLLSVLIKVQELKNTMELFSKDPQTLGICAVPEDTPKQGFFDVLNEIMEYGSPEQKQAFHRFNTLLQLASMYEHMPSDNTASTEGSPSVKNAETDNTNAENIEKQELSAASLATGSDPVSKGCTDNSEGTFRTYIRNSLTEEQKTLFDSYCAMFHSLGSFAGKESC